MKLAEMQPSANRTPDVRICCKSLAQVNPRLCLRLWAPYLYPGILTSD